MLNITKLYSSVNSSSDSIRYNRGRSIENIRPIVVWNCTQRCNLVCKHCYANASSLNQKVNELSTTDARSLIKDLSSFRVPSLLFSGGEPLIREDIYELLDYAKYFGLRTVLSTNGTLIDKDVAKRLKDLQISYVGISIDGKYETHSSFRNNSDCYYKTIEGIRHCVDAGIKVGLRFTITESNYRDIPFIFNLMKEEKIRRICFYHLVSTGRGKNNFDLSHEKKREVMDFLIDSAHEMAQTMQELEILTVANHCDAIFLYLRMLKEKNIRAQEVLDLIKTNGSLSSGVGISAINWDGDVYPDQFWRNKKLGNVRNKKFSDIWLDKDNEFLAMVRNRENYITGRCSKCRYLLLCKGNFRARAEGLTGEMWASDPGCYLTDEEIGINPSYT